MWGSPVCHCSLTSANSVCAEQSLLAWAGGARCLQTSALLIVREQLLSVQLSCLEIRDIIGLKKKEIIIKKINLSGGGNAAMIQENTVIILQLQLNKSMGNRGRDYAACSSGQVGLSAQPSHFQKRQLR